MEVVDKLLFNGAKYSGNIKDNMPHGYGIYETNNIKYEGYFYHGQFHLYGVLYDKILKYKYSGSFNNGMRDGFGIISFDDGRYFEPGKGGGFKCRCAGAG